MSVRIHSPEGAVGTPPVELTPTPDVLSGVKVGILDNLKPHAGLLMGRVVEQMASRTGVELVRVDTKNAAIPAPDEILEGLSKEVEIVLTGSAD